MFGTVNLGPRRSPPSLGLGVIYPRSSYGLTAQDADVRDLVKLLGPATRQSGLTHTFMILLEHAVKAIVIMQICVLKLQFTCSFFMHDFY